MIICLFGFYRNADNYQKNLENNKTYIYCPNTTNENCSDKITYKYLNNKYPNSTIELYEYNKKLHIDKALKLNIPRFNEFYQQSYRIFSFFYNIKMVLQMLKNKKYRNSDLILLSRIDIGLNIKYDKINAEYDIIAGSKSGKGVDDKWFLFKYKYIDVFISLYDDYEGYLINYYKGKLNTSTRPEDIFLYHFIKNGLSVLFTDTSIIEYKFNHVCSEYCGHNGPNTKM